MWRILVMSLLALAALPLFGQAQQDVEWAEQHFASAFRTVFPLPAEEETIGCRHYQDLYHGTQEFSLVLTYDLRTAKVSGVVREVVGSSLFDQLVKLHASDPGLPLDQVVAKVRMRETAVSESECPAVRRAFEAFTRLHFTAPEVGTIALHPYVYQCRVSGAGSMDITIFQVTNPLVKWLERFRNQVGACRPK